MCNNYNSCSVSLLNLTIPLSRILINFPRFLERLHIRPNIRGITGIDTIEERIVDIEDTNKDSNTILYTSLSKLINKFPASLKPPSIYSNTSTLY